ncbi:MAG: shikimate kinase [Pseudomonadota bacterium]|nr:shikimate kinase [Pseudomonadota bacterium]
MSIETKSRAGRAPAVRVDRPVVLVGMMGVGKTTVGRRLAPALGLAFFDADAEIEKAAGMSVSDLFAEHGEASFRQGEAKVIARLLDGPPIVLATGGGAVLDAGTRALIRERALSIWIRAELDVIHKRAARRGGRPLLKTGDPRATLERLLEARKPLYAEADIIIDSRPGPHSRTVEAIVEAIAAHLASEEKAGE